MEEIKENLLRGLKAILKLHVECGLFPKLEEALGAVY
jgi:hypothetical protein